MSGIALAPWLHHTMTCASTEGYGERDGVRLTPQKACDCGLAAALAARPPDPDALREAIERLPKHYAPEDSGAEEAWVEWADLSAVLREFAVAVPDTAVSLDTVYELACDLCPEVSKVTGEGMPCEGHLIRARELIDHALVAAGVQPDQRAAAEFYGRGWDAAKAEEAEFDSGLDDG